MLEGLEVSVLKLSEALTDNEKFRIDNEFFIKKYVSAYAKIKGREHKRLFEVIDILTDFSANGSYADIAANFKLLDERDYAYMVRTTDLEKNDFETDVKYVNEHTYNYLEKSKVFGGELLINKIGSPGRTFLMPKLNIPTSLGMNLFLLRTNVKQSLSEKFLWAYFNSAIGKNIIYRKVNGTVPLTIDKEAIRTLYVPIISNDIILSIEKCIADSELISKKSKSLYIEAENILLQELGLGNWQPTIKNNNTKTLKESFLSSGRIDAEYYQPKYDEVEFKITNYKCGYELVKNICAVKTQNFQPENDESYRYIELANIGSNGVIKDVIVNEGKELPSRARRLVKANDVIVSSVEGSLSSCAIISKELDNSICSTGFYVLNSKKINSETLLLLFKSAVLHLMEKGCSGTILTAINNEEFFKIPLPLIDDKIQKTISEKIQQSFALQSKSHQLLEAAKRAVEIAIEQNEEAAINFIKENSN